MGDGARLDRAGDVAGQGRDGHDDECSCSILDL